MAIRTINIINLITLLHSAIPLADLFNNNNNKRPLTPKSMPPAGDEHAKLKT